MSGDRDLMKKSRSGRAGRRLNSDQDVMLTASANVKSLASSAETFWEHILTLSSFTLGTEPDGTGWKEFDSDPNLNISARSRLRRPTDGHTMSLSLRR